MLRRDLKTDSLLRRAAEPAPSPRGVPGGRHAAQSEACRGLPTLSLNESERGAVVAHQPWELAYGRSIRPARTTPPCHRTTPRLLSEGTQVRVLPGAPIGGVSRKIQGSGHGLESRRPARACGFESHPLLHRRVAQRSEQSVYNRQVVGSSPAAPTNFLNQVFPLRRGKQTRGTETRSVVAPSARSGVATATKPWKPVCALASGSRSSARPGGIFYATLGSAAPVAQSVEHLPCKQDVAGSIPAGGSTSKSFNKISASDAARRGVASCHSTKCAVGVRRIIREEGRRASRVSSPVLTQGPLASIPSRRGIRSFSTLAGPGGPFAPDTSYPLPPGPASYFAGGRNV